MTLWTLLFYTWCASEIVILILTRTRRGKDASIQDRGSLILLWCMIVGSMTAAQWIAATHQPNLGQAARTSAVVLIVCGLAIRWFAVLSLGRSFSANVAIRSAQALHTSGLYAIVRHPSYLGLLLIFLAAGLATRQWLPCLIAVFPPMGALLYRIHIEEIALRSAFGDAYRSYSLRTKRLIPGLL